MAGEVLPIKYWLLDFPLYSPVEISSDINKAIKAILIFKKTMDFYCPDCKQSATFNAVISADTEKAIQDEIRNNKQRLLAKAAGSPLTQRDVWQLPSFSKKIVCTRANHLVDFILFHMESLSLKLGNILLWPIWQLVTTANLRKLLAKFDYVNLTWE